MPLSDASLQLQAAIVAWLRADPGVNAIVNGRIYDNVPQNAVKPYIAIGPFQVLPEAADCSEGAEIFVTLDGFDSGPPTQTIKRLGAALGGLHQAELALGNGQRLVSMSLEATNYLRDPDNITTHASVTLRALTEPTNP